MITYVYMVVVMCNFFSFILFSFEKIDSYVQDQSSCSFILSSYMKRKGTLVAINL